MWKQHCKEGRIPKRPRRKISRWSALKTQSWTLVSGCFRNIIPGPLEITLDQRYWIFVLWLLQVCKRYCRSIINTKIKILTRSSIWDVGVFHHKSPPSMATLITWKILSLLNASYRRSLNPLKRSTLNWCHQLVHHCSEFTRSPASFWKR